MLKDYRDENNRKIFGALIRAKRETKESYSITKINYDTSTNQFVISVNASDNFHNKAISYL